MYYRTHRLYYRCTEPINKQRNLKVYSYKMSGREWRDFKESEIPLNKLVKSTHLKLSNSVSPSKEQNWVIMGRGQRRLEQVYESHNITLVPAIYKIFHFECEKRVITVGKIESSSEEYSIAFDRGLESIFHSWDC